MKNNVSNKAILLLGVLGLIFFLPFYCLARQPDTASGYYLRKARDIKTDPYERIASYDSLLSSLSSDYPKFVEIGREKVKLCNSIHRADLGADTWDNILVKIKNDDPSRQCRILAEASLADRRASRHRAMISKVMDILAIDKPDSLRPFNVYAYLDLAGMFHDFDNVDRSRYYIEKAQEEYQSIKEKEISEYDLNRMATHLIMGKVNEYIWNKKYGNAKAELNKMESYSLSEQMESGVLFNQALLYNLQNEPEKAEKIYKRLLTEFETDSRDVAANNYLFQLLEEKRYADAGNLIASFPETFQRLKSSYIAPSVYRNLVVLSKGLGNYESALAYGDSLISASDSLSSVRVALYGSGLVDQIEDMERVRIAEKNADEKGRLLIWVSILGGAAVIVAFVTLWLWFRLRRRIRQNRSLETRLDTLGETHRQEMKSTVDNLESRNRELTTVTMRMAAISTGIDRIKQLASDNSHSRDEMSRSIIDELKRMSLNEGVWEMFSYYFDNVNTGFYDRLREYCPQLTNAERRMCAFIVMNLTNKEIASLTSRSVRTVECIKYNLRRKLGIDIPTDEFLRSLNK